MTIKPRSGFWNYFLSEFIEELRDAIKELKIKDSVIEENLMCIGRDVAAQLDDILLPAILLVCNKGENVRYTKLFSGSPEQILHVLESQYPKVMQDIYLRLLKFKLSIFKALQRVKVYWDQIVARFGFGYDVMIESIAIGAGDPHYIGYQSIKFKVSKDSGFIYKPISLKVDEEVNKFISDIESNYFSSKWQYPRYLNIDGDEKFGFIKYIDTHNKLSAQDDVERIFRLYGKLIAYGRLLKITDGHADNMIVQFPNVYWIDLETAFHSSVFLDDDTHPIEMTGLLYEFTEKKAAVGIVTALQGGRIPKLRLTRPTIENDGTDDIKLGYFGWGEFKAENKVFLNDRLCYLEDYVDQVKQGYIETMCAFIQNKESILAKIKHVTREQLPVRFLCLTTVCYARYIGLLQHPLSSSKNILSFIKNEREKLLLSLDDRKRSFIIQNELLDICNGVIPYFYRYTNSKHLYHTSGAVCENFFDCTIYDELKMEIRNYSIEMLESDLAFIDKAAKSTKNIFSLDDFILSYKFPLYKKR